VALPQPAWSASIVNPRFIIIDGKAHVWRELVKLRRQQLQELAKAKQMALFEFREDCRPETDRTASRRYLEPSLFSLLDSSRNQK
jgi:hypothetical protein